jgi:hypothetical protein
MTFELDEAVERFEAHRLDQIECPCRHRDSIAPVAAVLTYTLPSAGWFRLDGSQGA